MSGFGNRKVRKKTFDVVKFTPKYRQNLNYIKEQKWTI